MEYNKSGFEVDKFFYETIDKVINYDFQDIQKRRTDYMGILKIEENLDEMLRIYFTVETLAMHELYQAKNNCYILLSNPIVSIYVKHIDTPETFKKTVYRYVSGLKVEDQWTTINNMLSDIESYLFNDSILHLNRLIYSSTGLHAITPINFDRIETRFFKSLKDKAQEFAKTVRFYESGDYLNRVESLNAQNENLHSELLALKNKILGLELELKKQTIISNDAADIYSSFLNKISEEENFPYLYSNLKYIQKFLFDKNLININTVSFIYKIYDDSVIEVDIIRSDFENRDVGYLFFKLKNKLKPELKQSDYKKWILTKFIFKTDKKGSQESFGRYICRLRKSDKLIKNKEEIDNVFY